MQLRADLAQLDRALHDMPADLAHSADVPRLERAIHDMDAALANSPPLDRDAAWRLFATLNPLLADGHLFVGFLDWRGETRAHLAAGGTLFPFEMRVNATCELRVRAGLGGSATELAGLALRRVNGISAGTICERMLARAHGDTREFRADLLSRRFWFYYWKVFGAPAEYEIEFAGPQDARKIPGSAQLPQLLADETAFERQFQLQIVGRSAVLKLGTFAWPDQAQLLDFTRAAFTRIRAAGVRTLIIDLRDNGGGNDEGWVDGVMPYIAARPFRIGSRLRKRVVVADPARDEQAGQRGRPSGRRLVSGTVERAPALQGQGLRRGRRRHVFIGGRHEQCDPGFRIRLDRGTRRQRAHPPERRRTTHHPDEQRAHRGDAEVRIDPALGFGRTGVPHA
jgi:hypothetical protein